MSQTQSQSQTQPQITNQDQTLELFREDAYLQTCQARVLEAVATRDSTGLVLDQTVFYAEGGGQPGDSGSLVLVDGSEIEVTNTIKNPGGAGILHVLAADSLVPAVGSEVTCQINWERRHKHMRLHSCLHLLCSLVDGGVTGGSIGNDKARLDFDLQDTTLDKEHLTQELNRLITEAHPLQARWITEEEMQLQPELVRTMSVKPPSGEGRVRLMEVADVDLQACGGTHVANTAEIGAVRVGKIENKGKRNRRVNILFDE
jgi:misacylated tRNA(Ala) deacylase